MSSDEKALIRILKKLNQDLDTVTAIILTLREKKNGASLLIEFLKNINPNQLTTSNILKKVLEITEKD